MARPRVVPGTLLGLVVQEVAWLKSVSAIVRHLYTGEDAIQLLNSVAPQTFGVVQQSLRESMVLGICRVLIDADHSKNLGLEALMNTLPRAEPSLERRLEELRASYDDIRLLRNKLHGHLDEHVAYAVAYAQEHRVRTVSDNQLFQAIADISELLNEVTLSIGFRESLVRDPAAAELDHLMSVLRVGMTSTQSA